MTEIELAYIAGIVDGEGCIGIYHRLDTKGNRSYQLCVQVGNTDKALIEWLHKSFGAYMYEHKHYSCEKIKRKLPSFVWTIVGNQALSFLEIVHPYLRIKKEQAEIAIGFQKHRRRLFRKRLDEDERIWQETQKIAMSNLNQHK